MNLLLVIPYRFTNPTDNITHASLLIAFVRKKKSFDTQLSMFRIKLASLEEVNSVDCYWDAFRAAEKESGFGLHNIHRATEAFNSVCV